MTQSRHSDPGWRSDMSDEFVPVTGGCLCQAVRYEADVNLVARFLMERFIRGGVSFESEPVRVENNILYFVDPNVKGAQFTPSLKLLSIDIECSMALDLYSIALYGNDIACVLMVDPEMTGREKGYRSFPSEKELGAVFPVSRIVRLLSSIKSISW